MPEPELPGYGDAVPWHTLETIRTEWEDAEHIADTLLTTILHAAREEVEAFAPALPDEMVEQGTCPQSYQFAHLMQTRNLWNAAEVAPGGDYGEDSFTIRPVPLDWIIKQLLRPKRAVPVAL